MPTRQPGFPLANIAFLLKDAATQLQQSSDTPRLDAEMLLCHVLKRPRGYLHAHPEYAPGDAALEEFRRLLAARRRGEPCAYLTAEREFWSMPLRVTPATLIPRTETELLVEEALRRIPVDSRWQILDLGTGSGAIALAIARERSGCRISATDLSADALSVARQNAKLLEIPNVEFLQGDWFKPLGERRFELIVSNPPYIRERDPHLQTGDLRFEPRQALVSGSDGLDAIRAITASATAHLLEPGWLLLEHGYDQAEGVRAILTGAGFTQVQSMRDLQGHERASLGAAAT
jgi:release factor glutamine methyltransferase